MSIIRYNPFKNLPSDFFGEDFFDHFRNSTSCRIPVDIYEKDGNVNLDFELPGMSKDDIDIELDKNTLTIRGSFEKDKEIDENDYYRKERYEGSFSRSFTLPVGVTQKDIDAKFKDGILKVIFPKQTEEEPKKKIEVK
ncbi:MAG: Hsp20/alpha crystallin family protein [Candidatus Cloacimonetes bacterium]|nr:Hsp20/alpha crystallin family protein [Candidatus Cloacimonadota bacterium]